MTAIGWLAQPSVLPWVAAAFGLCVGSFLNVVIHRLPRMMEREWLADVPAILEESETLKGRRDVQRIAGEIRDMTRDLAKKSYGLVVPRSHCPACGRKISALENVPLLSFLILRGKCAGCGTPISLRYPAVELLAAVAAWYGTMRYGLSWHAIAAIVFVWATIALAFIDQATGYLPDQITLPLLWLGILVNVNGTFVSLRDAVLGAVSGYLFLWSVYWIFKLIFRKEGMGYGDFKMNAAVGAFLGWTALPLVIVVSSVVGVVFGVAQMIAAKGGWRWGFRFHFGPYLAIAGVVAMFWGPEITRRWLPLFA